MKKFLIEEGGRYKVSTYIYAENQEKALKEFDKAVYDELPEFVRLMADDTMCFELEDEVEE